MILQPVTSSDIASIGYENGTLYIQFHSGGLYEYTNVHESIYHALITAPSQGKYFHAHIKGKYCDHRIG